MWIMTDLLMEDFIDDKDLIDIEIKELNKNIKESLKN